MIGLVAKDFIVFKKMWSLTKINLSAVRFP